ncbi:MAG: hypothetical protein DRI74_05775 [Bacteroidetes bacterium]|nr:MAG: hypothetical protein DRI74_05775 [Bacteroidota bacterium]
MKKVVLVILIVFLGFTVQAQHKINASINSSCVSQPANLVVPSGKTASAFAINTLVAGNNCYSGAAFTNKGFVIKAANGNIVYRYNRDGNGKVQESGAKLSSLKLGAGNYTVWVDGGIGAQLVLSYRI